MQLGKGLLLCLSACLLSTAAAAETTGWKCHVSHIPSSRWITADYVINHDHDAQKLEVVDALIHYYKHGFIPAEVTRDDDKTISFTWIVRGDGSGGGKASVRFDASIVKATQEFRISSTPLGYDNLDRTRGTCTATDGPLALKAG